MTTPKNIDPIFAFNKAIDKVENVHPDQIAKLFEEFNLSYSGSKLNTVHILNWIRQQLNITKPLNRLTTEYWVTRGWCGRPNSVVANMKPRLSIQSLDYWLEKGYSKEEAEYKRLSKNHMCKEYWLEKGYSLEDSIHISKERTKTSSTKGSQKSAERSYEENKLTSIRCLEYWILYHLGDIEKAKDSLRDTQSTFSLEKCIEKHGADIGLSVWENRQMKWQDTLKSKTDEDTSAINEKKALNIKNFIRMYMDSGKIEYEKYLISRGLPILKNEQDVMDYISTNISTCKFFTKPEIFILEIPEYVTALLEFDFNVKWLTSNFIFKEGAFRRGLVYNRYTDKGTLLKSSQEIYFYDLLLVSGFIEDIDFEIDKKYPSSLYRCDFYITAIDEYIEICGGGYVNMTKDDYKNHMEYKKTTFGSVLLWTIKDYKNYMRDLCNRL